MFREKCPVLANEKVAPGHYVIRLGSPRIAKNAKPGQFVQISCGPGTDPLLPRPFSFLTTTKKDISILYHVVGAGTRLLAQAKKGDALWVLGPLGTGFSAAKGKTALLVGGGVGIPPLYHFAQTLDAKTVHVFLGARDKSLLLCEKDFKKLGVNLHLSTDDGSKGAKGFVTGPFEAFLKKNAAGAAVYTCGPTPMMKAVAKISAKYKVPCQVSVEVPMACGFGVCLGCAVEVEDAGKKRFALACVEGPVFKGDSLVW